MSRRTISGSRASPQIRRWGPSRKTSPSLDTGVEPSKLDSTGPQVAQAHIFELQRREQLVPARVQARKLCLRRHALATAATAGLQLLAEAGSQVLGAIGHF